LDNPRGIICRKGHPLASARSLTDLVNAEWVTTSLTFKAEDELGPLFAQYGLPEPRPIFHAHSALSFVTAMVSSDALALLPICLAELTIAGEALEVIPISESLPELPICLVRRNNILPTPATEYFCDMVRRAAGHVR